MLRVRGPADCLESRARVAFDLACIERSRHARVLELLDVIFDTIPLTAAQAREVADEIATRRAELHQARRRADAANYAIRVSRTRDRRLAAQA